jgi:hypothetical protein
MTRQRVVLSSQLLERFVGDTKVHRFRLIPTRQPGD